MLKEFVWNTFEMSGEIDFYMFFKEIEEKNKVYAERRIAEDEAAISNI